METEDEEDILAEYVDESREHLAHIERVFTEIQKTGEVPPGVINDLFRAIHTIKGSSSFLGLTNIGTLAHAMESLLDSMREHRLLLMEQTMMEQIVSAFLESTDALNDMFDDITKSNDLDVSELVDLLKYLNSDNK